MSILSGYGKFKRYVLTDTGYKLCSQWTSSDTLHFDDNKTAQKKLGAIDGITDSLTSTSSKIALSAKSGKNLQDQISELNTGIRPRNLSITKHSTEYVNFDNMGVGVQYVAGIAFINLYFYLEKPMPGWTSALIAHIDAGLLETTYAVAVTPCDNTSGILIVVDIHNDISISTHDAVSKPGWYYATFAARCMNIMPNS